MMRKIKKLLADLFPPMLRADVQGDQLAALFSPSVNDDEPEQFFILFDSKGGAIRRAQEISEQIFWKSDFFGKTNLVKLIDRVEIRRTKRDDLRLILVPASFGHHLH